MMHSARLFSVPIAVVFAVTSFLSPLTSGGDLTTAFRRVTPEQSESTRPNTGSPNAAMAAAMAARQARLKARQAKQQSNQSEITNPAPEIQTPSQSQPRELSDSLETSDSANELDAASATRTAPSWKELRADRMKSISESHRAHWAKVAQANRAAASAAALRKSMLSGTYRFCPGGKCR